jgi:hypothetical protein
MPSRLSQDKDEADPTIADTWSLQKDAKLNREYTLVDNDTINEQDYEIIPNIKTTLVEKNPRRPPHPLDHYAHNRSYIRILAERMEYWVTDPAARLRGGKQRTPGERSDRDRAIDDAAWVAGIKDDIRCLWDNMGVGQDLLDDELQHFRVAFFHECRETLEKIEEEGYGVSFARVQNEIRTVLVSLGLRLSGERLKIMKEMSTDKQPLQNRYSFTFEEQRQIGKSVAQIMEGLPRWEQAILRKRLLSEMPPEQRYIYTRHSLDVVRRYFNKRAVESFAERNTEFMETELKRLLKGEQVRSRILLLEELERQQKHSEEQVELLREKLELQKR